MWCQYVVSKRHSDSRCSSKPTLFPLPFPLPCHPLHHAVATSSSTCRTLVCFAFSANSRTGFSIAGTLAITSLSCCRGRLTRILNDCGWVRSQHLMKPSQSLGSFHTLRWISLESNDMTKPVRFLYTWTLRIICKRVWYPKEAFVNTSLQ